jgi:hypothetical protein
MRSSILLALLFIGSIADASPIMKIEVEKIEYKSSDLLVYDLIIECDNSEELCILDTGIIERMNSDIPLLFTNINNPSINKGVLFSGNFKMGNDYFILPKNCQLRCKKVIDLKKFDLPPGDYEFKATIPGYIMHRKECKKFLNELGKKPYEDPIRAKTKFTIVE